MSIDDIAVDLQLKVKEVKDYMVNWELFKEYCEVQDHREPSQYSMIAGAPSKVRKHHFNTTKANREQFFDLISPKSGKQKIFGAAFDLRTYNKVVDNTAAREALYNEPQTSMSDALEIVKASDALAAMPFLKKSAPCLCAESSRPIDSLQTAMGLLPNTPSSEFTRICSICSCCKGLGFPSTVI